MNSSSDGLKREFGEVFTPLNIALSICARLSALDLLHGANVLEPSVGDGAFITALNINESKAARITAVDLNAKSLALIAENVGDITLNKIHDDFTNYVKTCVEEFDLVLGNPPYIKRNRLSHSFREYAAELCHGLNYPINMAGNAWTVFILASCEKLRNNGSMAMVVPYELLTVDHGKFLTNYLSQKFSSVEISVGRGRAFPKIEQDGVVLLAIGKRPSGTPCNIKVVLCDGLDTMDVDARRDNCKITLSSAIWSNKHFVLSSDERSLIDELLIKFNPISEYCSSTAGLVTGANDYFIVSRNDVERLGLSEYAVPIIKRGAQVKHHPEFTDADLELIKDQKTTLLDFRIATNSLLSDSGISYVRFGEEANVNVGYKLRNRTPWYVVPRYKRPEMIFFKRAHLVPKLMLNYSSAVVTDAGYVINMKNKHSSSTLLMAFYSTLGILSSELQGRFYGGGVLELTPNEFRSVRVPYLEDCHREYAKFKDVWSQEGLQAAMDFSDERLVEAGILQRSTILQLKKSLETLRAHRLRHSGISN